MTAKKPAQDPDRTRARDAMLRPLYRLWALSALASAGEIPAELVARTDTGLRAGKSQEGDVIDPSFAYFDSIC